MNLDGLGVARVELGFVERAFVALRDPDLRKTWKDAKKPLRSDLRAHSKDRAGPESSWPSRAAATTARRGQPHRPRKMLGRLPTAMKVTSDRRSVRATSRAAWSSVQQDGDVAGHGARIPARPFAWASDLLLATCEQLLAKGLEAVFKKVR